mmetsp:Transcript_22097/g.29528  ORF Transcript_22097/g.29528 Transcript_22097/m.29528 type:complete len:102 (+) Transcript_22097:85-390(+)
MLEAGITEKHKSLFDSENGTSVYASIECKNSIRNSIEPNYGEMMAINECLEGEGRDKSDFIATKEVNILVDEPRLNSHPSMDNDNTQMHLMLEQTDVLDHT